mgnify:CR=1 FL=1
MAMTLDEMTNQDVLDTRDVIERIKELEDLQEDPELTDDEREELASEYSTLRQFEDEASGYTPDWESGEGMIRDSYFIEYARELAEDIGAIAENGGWPTYCIDWDWAARELQMDYSSVELDGVTYWTR